MISKSINVVSVLVMSIFYEMLYEKNIFFQYNFNNAFLLIFY